MKRELRQQIMKRMVRDLPNLIPFMIGAAVGAAMNRRDTRKLAERIRKDLREQQVAWDRLVALPAAGTARRSHRRPSRGRGPLRVGHGPAVRPYRSCAAVAGAAESAAIRASGSRVER